MTHRIAINGFGRIGRLILRALIEEDRRDLEIVAINDLGPVDHNAHLLRFDSVHGRFPGTITTDGNTMDAGRGPIRVTAERDAARLNWSDIDLVLDCTGLYKDAAKARIHLERGARRVLISAPAKGADRTVVYGVNHDSLRAQDTIISNASCTTNCLAPVAQVLHQAVGIQRGFMTTVHAYTGDQPTLDRNHSDLYRARAAALSMIPTSTGAAKSLGLVLPELEGKLDGVALRVPTPNVSAVDLTFDAARATSTDEINAAIIAAAEGRLKGILATTDQRNVSIDFNHDPHSAVFHLDQTRVMEDRLVRVLAWYDNEWAYALRMLDTAGTITRLA